MDEQLIRAFRDKANENDCCRKSFSNIDGRNKWNCICSAMDWITVAIASIDFSPSLQVFGENDETTIAVLTLLMRIAIIKEGIEQLHRILMNTNETYRNNENIIWPDNPYTNTDNEYFEMIRACFGAHPINLKLKRFGASEIRHFASWPYVSENGFEVMLYPNTIHETRQSIAISFSALEEYTKLRYQHLMELTDVITKAIIA